VQGVCEAGVEILVVHGATVALRGAGRPTSAKTWTGALASAKTRNRRAYQREDVDRRAYQREDVDRRAYPRAGGRRLIVIWRSTTVT
jgi:hypothetical protein